MFAAVLSEEETGSHAEEEEEASSSGPEADGTVAAACSGPCILWTEKPTLTQAVLHVSTCEEMAGTSPMTMECRKLVLVQTWDAQEDQEQQRWRLSHGFPLHYSRPPSTH